MQKPGLDIPVWKSRGALRASFACFWTAYGFLGFYGIPIFFFTIREYHSRASKLDLDLFQRTSPTYTHIRDVILGLFGFLTFDFVPVEMAFLFGDFGDTKRADDKTMNIFIVVFAGFSLSCILILFTLPLAPLHESLEKKRSEALQQWSGVMRWWWWCGARA